MELEEELEKQPAHHKEDKVGQLVANHVKLACVEGTFYCLQMYTVNRESKYIVVRKVPAALGVKPKLLRLFSCYGKIEEHRLLDDYPSELNTDVYWIKYADIDSARLAKKKLNHTDFCGKKLCTSYAPQYESVQETREKLQRRRKVIANKTRESTLPRQTGSTSRTTDPISMMASTLPRQTGSTSRQSGPAVDNNLHRVTNNSNGTAEMAKTLHYSSTPLLTVTGNHSLDKSIQSVRDQMTKVWETAPITLTKPKPKKRKRI